LLFEIILENNEEHDIDDINISLPPSDVVAYYIIEKLISLTITNSYKKDIELNIGKHCFYFLKSLLNHMVIMESVSFDREDYNIDIKQLKKEEPIFYDTMYHGINDWSELAEPVQN
jgi:hypothetical protein